MTERKIKPTMTALQLSREAKEANGDCFFENKPVFIRTEDGELHRALEFTWDESVDGFVIVSVEQREKPLPAIPEAPAVLIGELVYAKDNLSDGQVVFICPGDRQPLLSWAELNALAAEQVEPIVPLVRDRANAIGGSA